MYKKINDKKWFKTFYSIIAIFFELQAYIEKNT